MPFIQGRHPGSPASPSRYRSPRSGHRGRDAGTESATCFRRPWPAMLRTRTRMTAFCRKYDKYAARRTRRRRGAARRGRLSLISGGRLRHHVPSTGCRPPRSIGDRVAREVAKKRDRPAGRDRDMSIPRRDPVGNLSATTRDRRHPRARGEADRARSRFPAIIWAANRPSPAREIMLRLRATSPRPASWRRETLRERSLSQLEDRSSSGSTMY